MRMMTESIVMTVHQRRRSEMSRVKGMTYQVELSEKAKENAARLTEVRHTTLELAADLESVRVGLLDVSKRVNTLCHRLHSLMGVWPVEGFPGDGEEK